MPELVAHKYVEHEMKFHESGTLGWMYLDDDGDLAIGVDHYIAGPETPRLQLEQAIRALWQYGQGPMEFDDVNLSGQEFGMQLRSRRPVPVVGIPVVNNLCPEMVGDPARHINRTDPDLIFRAPWDLMADEAEEMFALPHGSAFDLDFYQDHSTFRMDKGSIVKLFAADTQEVIEEIRGKIVVDRVIVSDFAAFNSYPFDAQLAIIDLAYQIGAAGLARSIAFRQAVGKADWTLAADLCPAIAAPDRNRWRKEQLLKAAAAR